MKILEADPKKCEGIRACERACAKALHKTEDVAYSGLRVERTEKGHRFTFCDQCGECIAICPTGALQRNKAGTVLLKKDLCVGCFMCIGFCPTCSIFKVPKLTEPVKCISCGNCVKACPQGALAMVQKDHAHLPS